MPSSAPKVGRHQDGNICSIASAESIAKSENKRKHKSSSVTIVDHRHHMATGTFGTVQRRWGGETIRCFLRDICSQTRRIFRHHRRWPAAGACQQEMKRISQNHKMSIWQFEVIHLVMMKHWGSHQSQWVR